MPPQNREIRSPAATATGVQLAPRPSLKGHIEIARVDHWVKNVFVLPGMVVALSVDRARLEAWSWAHFALGALAICLIASSNYVLNEILDAPFDLLHPYKAARPIPAGRASVPWAYVEWIALMAAGLAAGWRISKTFEAVLATLWIMGCLYNIPPIRTKDLPYVDVLSEAINNPLRMLLGWYLTGTTLIPPASLLLSYWMAGCYFMAVKRFAELRDIADPLRSARYRKSFEYYNEPRLLVSIMFYGSHAMLFFGAFMMRYRVEMLLAFPFVALVMAVYLWLGFKPDSAAQRPEGLWREPVLVAAVAACTLVIGILLFVDVPVLGRIFSPTIPTEGGSYFNR
jgi:decaprenyl-phosphate phosphoribosyltransferase